MKLNQMKQQVKQLESQILEFEAKLQNLQVSDPEHGVLLDEKIKIQDEFRLTKQKLFARRHHSVKSKFYY